MLQRAVHGSVEDDAVSLVVVGEAAVFAEVVVVDGRGEEELADVVDRLGPGVGEAEAAVADRAQVIGDGEGVVVGVRAGVVLLVVGVGGVGTAEVDRDRP